MATARGTQNFLFFIATEIYILVNNNKNLKLGKVQDRVDRTYRGTWWGRHCGSLWLPGVSVVVADRTVSARQAGSVHLANLLTNCLRDRCSLWWCTWLNHGVLLVIFRHKRFPFLTLESSFLHPPSSPVIHRLVETLHWDIFVESITFSIHA